MTPHLSKAGKQRSLFDVALFSFAGFYYPVYNSGILRKVFPSKLHWRKCSSARRRLELSPAVLTAAARVLTTIDLTGRQPSTIPPGINHESIKLK